MEWANIAEEMIEDVGVAEGQTEYSTRMHSGIDTGTEVRASYQLEADCLGHDDIIKQWLADGHEAIVGHHSQEAKLIVCTEGEKEKLNHTPRERNVFTLH